ncbi:MAG: HAD family phosphatase [Clostridia bacterium]|nr:HAD family phosphatase [Clostridia bacterium]
MIKQILFDCGGVLVEMKFKDTMLRISGNNEIADYFIKNIWAPGSPWLRYDRGEIGTAEVLAELKNFMPQEYHRFLEQFVDTWLDALPPMDSMPELIDALHERGYPCYLLSNFAERFEEMPDRTPALKKLDGTMVSYQAHMLKPDPAFYLLAAETFGFKPEETLFVDDVAANVEGAKAVGMEGYLFTTPAAFHTYLKQCGIL